MRKQPFHCIFLFLLICFSLPVTAAAQAVNIPDPNLRAAIEMELGKASGATITVDDMTNLTALEAKNSNINDLTGLEHAIELRTLNLEGNSISDLSPLAGLAQLVYLFLTGNAISDISPVANLSHLEYLALGINSISDISPVAGLINLSWLYLWGNSISDISSLVANTGLGSGDNVELRNNPLISASINTHIPTLQSRGVTVEFDPMVEIPDPNLRAAVEMGLGKASGATITVDDMANLIGLYEPNANITDLTGLEAAINLEELNLGDEEVEAGVWINSNSISDLSPLAGLTNLTELWIQRNNISDVSPLAGLTNLTTMSLGNNNITNISPLVGLTNLTALYLRENSISDISPLAGLTELIVLHLHENSISDISPLAGLTSLTVLYLERNNISDVSPLAGLTSLTELYLERNNISDVSPVVGLTSLTVLYLQRNNISDVSPVVGLTNLTELYLHENSISNISPLVGLTNLILLSLGNNNINNISPLVGLTNLTELYLHENSISNISPLVGLTNLILLSLGNNNINNISPLVGLTNLTRLSLYENSISDISPLVGLTNLTELYLYENSISDISPLVENIGLGLGATVNVSENPLNTASINIHIPALEGRGVTVHSDNLKPPAPEYTLSIPAGINLIHVPLKVREVDGTAQTIESVSNLYDALGGASKVNFLITYDPSTQAWLSYFVPSDKGGPADRTLTDDTGIIVGLREPVSVQLTGDALGTDGNSTIVLNEGINLVGLPLRDSRVTRVSDLFTLDGIGGNVPLIILTDDGEFKLVGRSGDPGDVEITGAQAFIMIAQQAVTVEISGEGWANASGAAAAPSLSLKDIEVGDTTPILALRGSILDVGTDSRAESFRVTLKNLSTGGTVAAVTTPDEAGYRATIVNIETGRAATVGDILEISAQSSNPFIHVEPLRYTVTTEDVKRSLIQLPNLVVYEIPTETQLLANYPNPFNPETWIPYQLAEPAEVTLKIYDINGEMVRRLAVGHRPAGVYQSRSRAVYWDGRNQLGESVVSGLYFYTLTVRSPDSIGTGETKAGEFSATRRMLILK